MFYSKNRNYVIYIASKYVVEITKTWKKMHCKIVFTFFELILIYLLETSCRNHKEYKNDKLSLPSFFTLKIFQQINYNIHKVYTFYKLLTYRLQF